MYTIKMIADEFEDILYVWSYELHRSLLKVSRTIELLKLLILKAECICTGHVSRVTSRYFVVTQQVTQRVNDAFATVVDLIDIAYLGPLLLTWFNFNPSTEK